MLRGYTRNDKLLMQEKIYCVYILTNKTHTVLYTGVSGNLPARVYQHSMKMVSGFTDRYNVNKLVYYETCSNPEGAIAREKQIKAGSRAKKIALIEAKNPTWNDLYSDIT